MRKKKEEGLKKKNKEYERRKKEITSTKLIDLEKKILPIALQFHKVKKNNRVRRRKKKDP